MRHTKLLAAPFADASQPTSVVTQKDNAVNLIQFFGK